LISGIIKFIIELVCICASYVVENRYPVVIISSGKS
jgi:hypothetical protein